MDKSIRRDEICDDILQYVKTNFPIKDGEINKNSSLIDEGIVDSMNIIQLICYIEEKYNLNFTEEDMLNEHLVTTSGLAQIVLEKTI